MSTNRGAAWGRGGDSRGRGDTSGQPGRGPNGSFEQNAGRNGSGDRPVDVNEWRAFRRGESLGDPPGDETFLLPEMDPRVDVRIQVWRRLEVSFLSLCTKHPEIKSETLYRVPFEKFCPGLEMPAWLKRELEWRNAEVGASAFERNAWMTDYDEEEKFTNAYPPPNHEAWRAVGHGRPRPQPGVPMANQYYYGPAQPQTQRNQQPDFQQPGNQAHSQWTNQECLRTASQERFQLGNQERSQSTNQQYFRTASQERFQTGSQERSQSTNQQYFRTESQERFQLGSQANSQWANQECLRTASQERFQLRNQERSQWSNQECFRTASQERFQPGNQERSQWSNQECFRTASQERFQTGNQAHSPWTNQECLRTASQERFQTGNQAHSPWNNQERLRTASQERFQLGNQERSQSTNQQYFRTASQERFQTGNLERSQSTNQESFQMASQEHFQPRNLERSQSTNQVSFRTASQERLPSPSLDCFQAANQEHYPAVNDPEILEEFLRMPSPYPLLNLAFEDNLARELFPGLAAMNPFPKSPIPGPGFFESQAENARQRSPFPSNLGFQPPMSTGVYDPPMGTQNNQQAMGSQTNFPPMSTERSQQKMMTRNNQQPMANRQNQLRSMRNLSHRGHLITNRPLPSPVPLLSILIDEDPRITAANKKKPEPAEPPKIMRLDEFPALVPSTPEPSGIFGHAHRPLRFVTRGGLDFHRGGPNRNQQRGRGGYGRTFDHHFLPKYGRQGLSSGHFRGQTRGRKSYRGRGGQQSLLGAYRGTSNRRSDVSRALPLPPREPEHGLNSRLCGPAYGLNHPAPAPRRPKVPSPPPKKYFSDSEDDELVVQSEFDEDSDSEPEPEPVAVALPVAGAVALPLPSTSVAAACACEPTPDPEMTWSQIKRERKNQRKGKGKGKKGKN